MDWTSEARQELDLMPPDGQQLILAARAELVTGVIRVSGHRHRKPRAMSEASVAHFYDEPADHHQLVHADRDASIPRQ
ncbi:hypothetical protein [Streptomyces sp. NBC_01431]|uniref:hypothetical protein n=1 Tax=Streptomyces sp. NBC_01431 TaxID=2903863 RepID=UPI002E330235|nr:hypothetical protein [Streptomyces sp. NBC_01431]